MLHLLLFTAATLKTL